MQGRVIYRYPTPCSPSLISPLIKPLSNIKEEERICEHLCVRGAVYPFLLLLILSYKGSCSLTHIFIFIYPPSPTPPHPFFFSSSPCAFFCQNMHYYSLLRHSRGFGEEKKKEQQQNQSNKMHYKCVEEHFSKFCYKGDNKYELTNSSSTEVISSAMSSTTLER